MWLFGIGLDIGAYFLEALALANGSIVLVQTLLVSGLLFALPLSAIGRTDRPGRQRMVRRARRWPAASRCSSRSGTPTTGTVARPPLDWVIAFAVCGAIIVAMVVGDPQGAAALPRARTRGRDRFLLRASPPR